MESAAQQLSRRIAKQQLDSQDSIVSAKSLQDLLTAIDPREKIDAQVEDMIMHIAEEFIASVATCSSLLAKHRGSQTLDVADVQLHLEKNWGIRVPGYSVPEPGRTPFRRAPAESHQRRMTVVKRAVASAQAPEAYSRKRKQRAEETEEDL